MVPLTDSENRHQSVILRTRVLPCYSKADISKFYFRLGTHPNDWSKIRFLVHKDENGVINFRNGPLVVLQYSGASIMGVRQIPHMA